MEIIAFVNNKGGVGKTTCSKLMAEYLSKTKKIRHFASILILNVISLINICIWKLILQHLKD